jgi:hypothetical protein
MIDGGSKAEMVSCAAVPAAHEGVLLSVLMKAFDVEVELFVLVGAFAKSLRAVLVVEALQLSGGAGFFHALQEGVRQRDFFLLGSQAAVLLGALGEVDGGVVSSSAEAELPTGGLGTALLLAVVDGGEAVLVSSALGPLVGTFFLGALLDVSDQGN